MSRLTLLERLKELQQTPTHRDITTVSAMLSTAALAKHVEVCEGAVRAAAARQAGEIGR